MVRRSLRYLESGTDSAKITWQVSLLALIRFVFYGAALATSALLDGINFFTTAGGLIFPPFAIQAKNILGSIISGGKDA